MTTDLLISLTILAAIGAGGVLSLLSLVVMGIEIATEE